VKTLIFFLAVIFSPFAYAESPGEVLNRHANDLARKGEFLEAIKLYDRAIAIEPNYPEPYYNRGKAKLSINIFRGAIDDFDLAISLAPDDADAFNNRGIAKRKAGDIDGAITDYSMALKLNPSLFRVYLNRGIARHASGDRRGALADFLIARDNNVPGAFDAVKLIQEGN